MASHTIENLEALAEFAQSFGRLNTQGGFFGLKGDLGAGKTAFVRAVIEGLCVDRKLKIPRVVSPSYVLHQHYALTDSLAVDHFDLYRLENLTEESLTELGFFEALDRVRNGSLLFVEWPERLPPAYQADQVLHFGFLEIGRVVSY